VLKQLEGRQAKLMGNGKIGGIRSPKPLYRLSQNLAWIIKSAT